MQFTKKQLAVWNDLNSNDWKVAIFSGGKRAGKTFLSINYLVRMLVNIKKQSIEKGIDTPIFILGGVTSNLIYTNVISEIQNIFNIPITVDSHKNYSILGVTVVPVATKNKDSLKSVRGLTASGAYINEGCLANPLAIEEIISRCSIEGSKVIIDTNPDSPSNFLYTDYIKRCINFDKRDNERENGLFRFYNFTTYDNPTLPKEYFDMNFKTLKLLMLMKALMKSLLE